MKTILAAFMALSLCSCGTLTQAGKPTDYQRVKPSSGPARQVKPGAVVFGVLFPASLIVDFATTKIYRPEPKK